MAVKYRRARAWIAALTVSGVVGGTVYFAGNAAQNTSAASATQTDVTASAPATNSTGGISNTTTSTQGQAATAPQTTNSTTTKPVATPVPRVKKTRGS